MGVFSNGFLYGAVKRGRAEERKKDGRGRRRRRRIVGCQHEKSFEVLATYVFALFVSIRDGQRFANFKNSYFLY